MASNLASPTEVGVETRISFHEALNAVEMFVDKFPAERLSLHYSIRLEQAAATVRRRLVEDVIRKGAA